MSFVNVTGSRDAVCPAAAKGNANTPNRAHATTARRPDLPSLALVVISLSRLRCEVTAFDAP